jgi:hypothetical protein
MATVAACRTCGTELLEHARFCHGCGSPVEDAGIRPEHKQVTVLLRLRALLAHAHGDGSGYRELPDQYRQDAKTLGFEGHIDWAEAMP